MAESTSRRKEAAHDTSTPPSRAQLQRPASLYLTPRTPPPAPPRGTLPSTAAGTRRRPPSPFAVLPPATRSSPSPSASRAPSTSEPAGASPRQEPGSARYLHRLLQIVKCTRAQPPGPEMADFLAVFTSGADDAAQSMTSACDSIDDLQLRLRATLDEKVTPTRAEHVATTLDIGATAQLTLSLSQAENVALEGLTNVDPSLGGIWSTSVTADNPGGLTLRETQAADSLADQPQDDPVLQRAIAEHIISAVGVTDGGAWVMREMSRGPQGWNFTYLCKDSSQQWDRQNKGRSKLVIGEFTNKEPDPKLMSRPAFDCRGCIKISFTRGSRSISVKYDHTPLHRTVAEVAELFKPPSRQVLDGPERKTPGRQGSGKKKRDSTKVQVQNGNPRKRRKKNDGGAQAQAIVAEHGPEPLAELAQNGQGTHDFANAVSVASSAKTGQGPAQPVAIGPFPVNVPPEEAARRRDWAARLLSDAGVEPDSLSTDQFSIFANQSPELQNESLSMLVKYGAERLRIIHPSNRESSTSVPPGAATTPAQAPQAIASGPTTTKELMPQPQVSGDAGSTSRKPGKSRNACFQCRERKVKCPRQRPACSECQVAGLGCEYAPQQPRYRKKNKSEAMVPADYDDDEGRPEGDAQEEQPQAEQQPEEAEGHNGDVDYSSYPQVPVADTLTPNADLQGQGPYFQSASGLALPQPEEPPVSQQMHTAGSGLMLPQGTVHYASHAAPTTKPAALHQSNDDPPVHLLASPKQSTQRVRGSRWSQLPDGLQASHATASEWADGIDTSTQAASKSTASPSMQQRGAGSHGSRGSQHRVPIDSPQIQEAVALSQAALEQQGQAASLPMAMQASAHPAPSQPADNFRTQSRQGQRGQATTPRGAQPAQSMDSAGHHRTPSAGMSDAPTYNSYGRYNDAVPNTSATKISYEPYSYERGSPNVSPYPSYDYGRTATSTTSMGNQGMTTMAPAYPSNTTNPNLLSSARTAPTRTQSPYNAAGAARPGHNSMGQSQQPQQQHQQPQQQQQQQQAQGARPHPSQGWYGFNNAGGNHPYAPGDQEPGYSWNLHDQSWGGVS